MPYARLVSESDQLRTTNSLPIILQESGAKRPAKLPQRESTEENDRADTLSDACQDGEADGDVPAHQSKMTKSAEAPEATQEAPLVCTHLHTKYQKIDLGKVHLKSLTTVLLLMSSRAQILNESLPVNA